jgi:hypothetical protein
MRCHSVGCGMTRQIMQSATQCTAAVHIDAVIRVYDAVRNVIETHPSNYRICEITKRE